jgi:quercetin dioxygenase-like cupin family protein
MQFRTRILTLLGALSLPLLALAHGSGKDTKNSKVTPIFSQPIPNLPGKSLKTVVVEYPPGGSSPAHRHAPSAFIYAHVLSGEIRSQVGDEPARVYRTGENFYEVPGAHHGVSENASATRPARLLAVFVVDSDDPNLTMPDPQ